MLPSSQNIRSRILKKSKGKESRNLSQQNRSTVSSRILNRKKKELRKSKYINLKVPYKLNPSYKKEETLRNLSGKKASRNMKVLPNCMLVKESQRRKESPPGVRHPSLRRLRGSLMRKRSSLSMRKGSPLKAKRKSGSSSVLKLRRNSKKESD